MIKLDIRVKILILIIANILMFKMMSLNLHLIVAIVFTLYLGITSNARRMINFFLIYICIKI